MSDEEISFHVTSEALHKLQLILSKLLKDDGELIPREIWHDEKTENEIVLNQTANMNDRATSISLARSRLKQSEELLGVFSFLQSSLENHISSFRARMPKWSITDLPNELLLLIFDYSEPDLRCLRGLLQVCRRFRQLVLSSPRLWARQTLGLHSSSYEINAVAKRSGKLGFRVGFDNEDDFEGSFGPEHAIFRHCRSWISLELHLLRDSDLQRLQTCAPCTNFSFLKELIIERCIDEEPVWQLSREWSLPSLRSLKCVDCVLRLPRASVLSECSFEFSRKFPLSDVTAFLSSSTGIVRLSLALRSVRSYSYDDTSSVVMVTLPILKSLAVHLVNVDESIITNIFRTMLSPNITSFLAIVAMSRDFPDPSRGLRLLTRGLNVRYPLLKRVGLGAISGVFDEGEPRYDQHDVNATLKDLPRGVEDLVLLINNQGCDISIPSDAVDILEGLRSFVFVHCNHLSEDFFNELPIFLKRYGIRLESIHIENCRICKFYDMDPDDLKGEKGLRRYRILERVATKVADSRSVMLEDILASLEEFMELEWY